MPSVLYLHGFASGPSSAKGRFFQQRFAECGIVVHQPDLAAGDFPGLTVTGQLEVARRVAATVNPTFVIGSSLGGYLAALLAAERGGVGAVVLLAPAFDFAERWAERLGEAQMRAWRESQVREIYHYGENRELPLRYEFYLDARTYPPFPAFPQPGLILHGREDEVVDAAQSIDYAQGKSNIRLEIVDSDHSLTDCLDHIWARVYDFYRTHEPAQPRDA